MLTVVDGTMPLGQPYRLWLIQDPIPGRPADAVVIAASGSIFRADRIPTVHTARLRVDLEHATELAEAWTEEQRQAHQDAVQDRWDRACEATREAP